MFSLHTIKMAGLNLAVGGPPQSVINCNNNVQDLLVASRNSSFIRLLTDDVVCFKPIDTVAKPLTFLALRLKSMLVRKIMTSLLWN